MNPVLFDTRLTNRSRGRLLSVSTLPLCAVCHYGCALSRARKALPLDSARLRGLLCAAGRLRQKQACSYFVYLRTPSVYGYF